MYNDDSPETTAYRDPLAVESGGFTRATGDRRRRLSPPRGWRAARRYLRFARRYAAAPGCSEHHRRQKEKAREHNSQHQGYHRPPSRDARPRRRRGPGRPPARRLDCPLRRTRRMVAGPGHALRGRRCPTRGHPGAAGGVVGRSMVSWFSRFSILANRENQETKKQGDTPT